MRLPFVVVGLVMLALALNVYGCSHSPTAPSPSVVPATPAPTPAPTLTGMRITGTLALTAIGQTTQLTATVTFSDNTTKDVTTATQWSSLAPAVVTVSSSGVVTALAFGVGNILAKYQTQQTGSQVIATPPNTSVFYGRVREPGSSGIPGVRIFETGSGQSTLSNSDGDYSFGALTSAHLRFEKDGFEPTTELDARPNQFNDLALQRIVRVTAGDSLTGSRLAPHDMSYTVGADRCFPCRLIRVTMPTTGALHVHLTWTEPRAMLNLWVNGGRFVGNGTSLDIARDVPVNAGEVLVYVGLYNLPPTQDGAVYYVPFSLATAMGITP